jgi:hypothetical protein
MKNTLNVLEAKVYKLAWRYDLQICGTENGMPQWLGRKIDLENFFNAVNKYKLLKCLIYK